jgi:hypothetical protein
MVTHLRHTTVGRTPLDERPARRRDLYLTSHTTHKRQTSIPPDGIRTHDPSKRAAEDPRRRPNGHWDRHIYIYIYIYMRKEHWVFGIDICSTRGLNAIYKPSHPFLDWCYMYHFGNTTHYFLHILQSIRNIRFLSRQALATNKNICEQTQLQIRIYKYCTCTTSVP